MSRRMVLSALATAAVALVAATTAGAGGAAGYKPAVKLAIGDEVDIKNTDIACLALRSNNKNGILCVLWGKDSPRPGTFAVGIAVDGTVVVSQVQADGTPKQLLKRTPQLHRARTGSAGATTAAAARGKAYTAVPGDSFGLPIDKKHLIGCRVVLVKPAEAAPLYQGIKVACWRADQNAPLPSTDGVQISERFAMAFSFDAKGEYAKSLILRKQPAA